MSLHAATTNEAEAALRAQKRNSTISSIAISLLSLFLIGLILYVIALNIEVKETPDLVSYSSKISDSELVEQEQEENEVQQKPATPNASAAKVISSITSSPTSIPTTDVEPTELSMEFADNLEFADFAIASPDASEDAIMTAFGGATKVPGTIAGKFYDFKQSREGVAVKNYDRKEFENFGKRVAKFQRRFEESALKDHFVSKKELFTRFIAVPFSEASEGPKKFGVANQVKPKGWMVHYTGKVIAPKDGKFRFAGNADDYLAVAINGRAHLTAATPSLRSKILIKRANSGKKVKDQDGPFGADSAARRASPLFYGRWFNVSKGEELQIDIAIGECPGGKLGFLLLIEEDGVDYAKQPGGAPILPPFTVGHLKSEDRARLNAFPNWKFNLKDIPVFESVD